MNRLVKLNLGKNKILVLKEDKAIEVAVQEYFCNNNVVTIDNKPFDLFNYSGYELKTEIQ